MATVTFKNVRKVYPGNVEAVKDFNLDIKDKEFVVFVGPSGCGKSTTLRMVAGLEEITAGEIYIDDVLVNNVEPKDRDISMVFQNYALYPHMTVFDNIAFPLKMRKFPKSEIKKRVEEAAKILEISELLGRKPKALSGGQRQRVAIGRAIVREPKVFLMDEPLSNLDAKLRNQMRSEIIKLRRRIDTTFIYVTHDQTEAMTLGDIIVVMNEGVIMQVGSPVEVFSRPKNKFVAGFIGMPQMNFIPGELRKTESGYAAFMGDIEIPLSDEINESLTDRKTEPQPVTFGVRPEDFVMGQQGIAASADVSEMTGSTINLHAYIKDTEVIVSLDYNDSRNGAAPGQIIHLMPDSRRIHIFSNETEKSLVYG